LDELLTVPVIAAPLFANSLRADEIAALASGGEE